jgi:hypothetical protein
MTDVIQWARIETLETAIAALEPLDACYMYLERVPDEWLTGEDRRDGLRLEKFDPDEDFDRWERGRIFCADFELRWERLDGAFQAVYVGAPAELPGFAPSADLNLDDKTLEERSYMLWGNRVPDDQLETVGTEEREGQPAFIEFQVPRVFYYPASDQAQRVRLQVREYVEPDSGARCYYRFLGLEEIQ